MTPQDFNIHCEQGLDILCRSIVEKKRPEYTEGSDDVLANFKKTAEECGLTPYQVLYVFMRKHWASIAQFVSYPERPQSEEIKLRIADSMNYHRLLYGLVIEANRTTKRNA